MKTIVRQIKQKRLMVLVLFLLVGMTSVFAQKHVSVSGRITDDWCKCIGKRYDKWCHN